VFCSSSESERPCPMGCIGRRWRGGQPAGVMTDSLWKEKMDFELEKNARENQTNDNTVKTPEVVIARCTG
jgi:hypothetical protein